MINIIKIIPTGNHRAVVEADGVRLPVIALTNRPSTTDMRRVRAQFESYKKFLAEQQHE
jgi:ribosomal protein S2